MEKGKFGVKVIRSGVWEVRKVIVFVKVGIEVFEIGIF